MRNDLRSRITVQVDGQMKTGRDVIVAGLLGAEEMGFSTAPLIATGCIMMRVCHLNTCPVGIATQDPVLRRRFEGTPEHVVNYFFLVADEAREIMARLGIRRFDDLIGRADLLELDTAINHWKAAGRRPVGRARTGLRPTRMSYGARWQDPPPVLDDALDHELIAAARPALDERRARPPGAPDHQPEPHRRRAPVVGHRHRPTARTACPRAPSPSRFTARPGRASAPGWPRGSTSPSTAKPTTTPARGSPAGCWPSGPRTSRPFAAEDNVIVGNTVLYGATSGRAFFRGQAGERFAVRNSGAAAVVEGVGDHGCEYMTGGRVVVLGETGRNFAAGMSGGIAYVLDEAGVLRRPLQHRPRGAGGAGRRRPRRRPGAGAGARPPHRLGAWPERLLERWEAQPPRLRQGHARATTRRPSHRLAQRQASGLMPDPQGFLRIGRAVPGDPHRDPVERVEATTTRSSPCCPPAEVQQQAQRCMGCGVPFCHNGCPLGNLIPEWNDLVYQGRWREAYERLDYTNNFPEFTGYTCPAPCEAACVLEINDDPVMIKQIELAIIERAFEEGWVEPRPPSDRPGGRWP